MLLASLCCWTGECLDRCAVVLTASDDPFDIPVLRGAKRPRRIAQEFKRAVVERGASSSSMQTNREVVVNIMKRKRLIAFHPKAAMKWSGSEAGRRWKAVQEALHNVASGVVSVTCDATRLGKREVLWAFCWIACLDRGAWAPPQATG